MVVSKYHNRKTFNLYLDAQCINRSKLVKVYTWTSQWKLTGCSSATQTYLLMQASTMVIIWKIFPMLPGDRDSIGFKQTGRSGTNWVPKQEPEASLPSRHSGFERGGKQHSTWTFPKSTCSRFLTPSQKTTQAEPYPFHFQLPQVSYMTPVLERWWANMKKHLPKGYTTIYSCIEHM